MIFHIPKKIYQNGNSGELIRPFKMLNAFREIGFDVELISGEGRERALKIEKVKLDIKKGTKYNFMYSESSTLPLLLTERHHLPRYPFLDYNFFYFLKEKGIDIGLFYRDIYWRFYEYNSKTKYFKRLIAKYFYMYDLYKYNQLVNILYLPSLLMYKYIPLNMKCEIKELPPGINNNIYKNINNGYNFIVEKTENDPIRIIYVGGIGAFYNFNVLLEAVNRVSFIKLIICCRKSDWENGKQKFTKYLNKNIEIIHRDKNELNDIYHRSDIASLFLEPIEYRNFAMPIKLFEYIEQQKPIIGINNTAAGNFIKKNDIGWVTNYSIDELLNVLYSIFNDKEILKRKKENIAKIAKKHTWVSRAKDVYRDLGINK